MRITLAAYNCIEFLYIAVIFVFLTKAFLNRYHVGPAFNDLCRRCQRLSEIDWPTHLL